MAYTGYSDSYRDLPRVTTIRVGGKWLLACDTNDQGSGAGAGAGAWARLGGGSRKGAHWAAAAIANTGYPRT
eukprot:6174678-Pleurochrysis_carterae.AAC.1